MRRLQFVASLFTVIAVVTSVALFMGCEDEPGLINNDAHFDANAFQNTIRIDGAPPIFVAPFMAFVSVIGEHIAFRAKGAVLPVSWSVSSTARGTIMTPGQQSEYALYTSTSVANNSVVATDARGHVAVAQVSANPNALRILPDQLNLLLAPVGAAGDFIVSGGVPPYGDFTETFPELGVVSQGGTYVVMTGNAEGTNLITITDAAGDLATAVVNHVLESDPLAIIPETTALDTNGDTANFIGTGGLQPYSWSLVYDDRGHINGSTSSTVMEYERDGEGDQVIILEDTLGNFTQAQVSQAAPTPPVIQPASVTLATNETTFAFAVTGGTPPYSWLVLTGTGTVTPNTGTAVVYTRGPADPANNYIIRVTDSASQSGLATITQE